MLISLRPTPAFNFYILRLLSGFILEGSVVGEMTPGVHQVSATQACALGPTSLALGLLAWMHQAWQVT